MEKVLHTEKDVLLKANGVFPWEKFRERLESLYRRKPKWDVILLFKTLLIKYVYDISWNNLEGEIRDSQKFREFLGEKVPPKSTVFLFYKKLHETVKGEEVMWTTLMVELNSLDEVIKRYQEKGFELQVGREKTTSTKSTT
ncbi:transposase [Metallosphaera hakonensis JCM 8857 = DSM 7519]|uniref:Transposase n=2 Tax=Metallosphaera hakonensis TaxID=79601 RepID=A0A2U9IX02_9CREN|nr:transposase [Metallosphaera hakonensis JCM 8857 = DSM 7519]AWS00523.1 transposase [Metallosphaera hakonensis JCM 8857 = DSM 7519]AWS00750.1 transposase [Metallosphaera hakonensis JCM 8857 = DSM 7519]